MNSRRIHNNMTEEQIHVEQIHDATMVQPLNKMKLLFTNAAITLKAFRDFVL